MLNLMNSGAYVLAQVIYTVNRHYGAQDAQVYLGQLAEDLFEDVSRGGTSNVQLHNPTIAPDLILYLDWIKAHLGELTPQERASVGSDTSREALRNMLVKQGYLDGVEMLKTRLKEAGLKTTWYGDEMDHGIEVVLTKDPKPYYCHVRIDMNEEFTRTPMKSGSTWTVDLRRGGESVNEYETTEPPYGDPQKVVDVVLGLAKRLNVPAVSVPAGLLEQLLDAASSVVASFAKDQRKLDKLQSAAAEIAPYFREANK